jgi:hypothetical protein
MGEFMTATPGERIGGWLIAPLAWLLVALLSASLALLLYTTALITPHAIQTLMSQSVAILRCGLCRSFSRSACGTTRCG